MEDIVSGSQTETSEALEPQRDAETEALYDSFGVKPAGEKKEIEFPNLDEPTDDAPAIEQKTEDEPTDSGKKLVVKYNKEDVEIDENEVPELVQKGLALDKVREQAKQREQELDRAAKLLGYKDHADLTANLDRIEQEKVKQQADQFEALKQQIIDDLVYNGVSEEAARQYAENNPLVQQARTALEEKQQAEQTRQQQTAEQERLEGWKQLYEAFPDAAESAKLFGEGKSPDWYTPEMQSMIERGYKPMDAYRLAHMDKIQTQSAKRTEQKLIKQQHLGARSQVESNSAAPSDETDLLPAQVALAESFGVSLDGVRKQQKQIERRR